MDMLSPGTEINGFRIIDKIANGNMGMVYRAIQINLNREVALKVLFPQTTQDEDFVRGFFREAQAAAAFTHQHIVQAYDVGKTDDDLYYFAMELVDGGDIQEKIKAEGHLNTTDTLSMLVGIADGLHHGNTTRQLTHSDLKPANILLTTHGVAKLADLGLARMGGEIQGESDGIMLTPLYAAPEMINETWKAGDPRADIYSFGATIYEMLSGTPPFNDKDYHKILDMQLHDKHVSLSILNPTIPQAVSDFVDSLLQKQPQDRPQDWAEVKKSMEQLLRNPKASAKKKKVFHVNSSKHFKKEKTNSHKPLLIVLSLLVITGLIFVFVLPNKNKDQSKEATTNSSPEVVASPTNQDTPKEPTKKPELITEQTQAPKPIKVEPTKVKVLTPEELLYRAKLKTLLNANLKDWNEAAEALAISVPDDKIKFYSQINTILDDSIKSLIEFHKKYNPQGSSFHIIEKTPESLILHSYRPYGTLEKIIPLGAPEAKQTLLLNVSKVTQDKRNEMHSLFRLQLLLNGSNTKALEKWLTMIKKPHLAEIIKDIIQAQKS